MLLIKNTLQPARPSTPDVVVVLSTVMNWMGKVTSTLRRVTDAIEPQTIEGRWQENLSECASHVGYNVEPNWPKST
ncbi:hypothetical protein Nepgr_030989 [Nepenthes gracilis]|uniref:Uncharacterized protein n=1 Tax=Nepenthes gracilis TaxID=150966 RepID=A0AAD3Y748_NEPGR|nr:hypothetical protein Nepgr_030989 [Nepenthes gracilis]